MSAHTAFGKQAANTAADECKKLPLHWEPISLTDDDENQTFKSNEALGLTDRPVRKDFCTICMRIAMIFVFLALLSTLMFIGLRFFVLLEQRAEMEMAHRGDLTNDEMQLAASDYYYSSSDSETASFELLFSTLMRALEEDSTRHRHPGCNRRRDSANTGRHHRRGHGEDAAGNEKETSEKQEVKLAQGESTESLQKHAGKEELDSQIAKSTQDESIMTDSSQQDDDSTSSSESQTSKAQVWGFVHKGGVRIVNGRVVSNWDQMIQFGPSDETKSDAQIGTAPSETAVALVQPSKTSGAVTEAHTGRGKHWGKSFMGGHRDSTVAPKPGRKHGRWPIRKMREWMSEQFGKFRNLFSSMKD